jgi:hypothetical protein
MQANHTRTHSLTHGMLPTNHENSPVGKHHTKVHPQVARIHVEQIQDVLSAVDGAVAFHTFHNICTSGKQVCTTQMRERIRCSR